MSAVDLAIIGTGPYGLSLAAHLRAAGVDFRIFGKTMDSWKSNMPPGMLLKSHPWSTSLYDPASSYPLSQFCADRAIAYHDSAMALPLETFVDYGEAFQARFTPQAESTLLVGLEKTRAGFRAAFDNGEVVTARKVVLAVGVHPFKRTPASLAHLPAGLLSHSGDHGPLDRFEKKEVVVLGAGSSAIDLAALLHERGAQVTLVARGEALKFAGQRRIGRSPLRRIARPFRRLADPGSGIGGGWLLRICADAPSLIHALPPAWRLDLVRNTLGPLGGAQMHERVVGKVPMRLGRELVLAEEMGGRARLRLLDPDGRAEILTADHVIAATGYQVDLKRLAFLGHDLLAGVRTVQNTPVLSLDYETSVPGLYVIGPASANSFGPVARFVFGAYHPARRLARHFARSPQSARAMVPPLTVRSPAGGPEPAEAT